jgi:hypothetical protein
MDYPLVSGAGKLKSLPQVMTPRKDLLKTLIDRGFESNKSAPGEAWIDDALGAVLKKLQEVGIDDNTLVLFAPDHGRRGKSSLFTADGVGIPMIARWPGQIPANSTCDELVENVDWVPTVFDVAGVTKPESYRVDGRSILPLLRGDENAKGRDHVYLEMGFARGVATKRWKYIAVRYPSDQIALIKRSSPERLPRAMSYIGRLGIGVRGADRPGFWDGDQLYDLHSDPEELTNHAFDPVYADQLKAMRELLTADLKSNSRPFGEFVPGGNAVPGGNVDEQISLVKTLTIRGKEVIVPKNIKSNEPARTQRESRRTKRLKEEPSPPSRNPS